MFKSTNCNCDHQYLLFYDAPTYFGPYMPYLGTHAYINRQSQLSLYIWWFNAACFGLTRSHHQANRIQNKFYSTISHNSFARWNPTFANRPVRKMICERQFLSIRVSPSKRGYPTWNYVFGEEICNKKYNKCCPKWTFIKLKCNFIN